MVKLLCFLRRHPDLDEEGFHRHWREHHGPLIAGLPNLARHLVRYEQHRRLDGELTGSEGYDGVTVQWFRRIEDFYAFVAEPDYAEHIAPDEARFLDRSALVWMIAHEPHVVIDGPTADPAPEPAAG